MKYKISLAKTFPLIDKMETGKRIRIYMDELGITVRDVKEYLNLGSVQSIYHWLEGKALPSTDNCFALSILFGVPVDEIICSDQKPPQILYDYSNCSSIELNSGRVIKMQ